jgi:hypothetical protein
VARALEAPPVGAVAAAGRLAGEPLYRRCEGFAGVAGDHVTSGAAALVAVADVARRREGLEEIVAGLAPGGMAVASWAAIAADLGLVRDADSWPRSTRRRAAPPTACSVRAPLPPRLGSRRGEVRPARVQSGARPEAGANDAFRALRALPDLAGPDAVETALSGTGRYPRTPECCARLLAVVDELGLLELAIQRRTCRVREGIRADLTLSSTYRGCGERLAAIEGALAAELPQRPRARAA